MSERNEHGTETGVFCPFVCVYLALFRLSLVIWPWMKTESERSISLSGHTTNRWIGNVVKYACAHCALQQRNIILCKLFFNRLLYKMMPFRLVTIAILLVGKVCSYFLSNTHKSRKNKSLYKTYSLFHLTDRVFKFFLWNSRIQ